MSPFAITATCGEFDVDAFVKGGGIVGKKRKEGCSRLYVRSFSRPSFSSCFSLFVPDSL